MKKFILSSALLAFVLAACTTTKDKEESVVVKSTTTSSTTAQLEPQQEELPKERAIFHGSETILTDLVHTSLQVEFDWEKSQLKGIEFLTAKPHFYPTDSLILDAKGMEIHSVSIGSKAMKNT